MGHLVQTQKKIALLHRYPHAKIVETNAAFPYLHRHGVDVLTYASFDRLSVNRKFWKSVWWIFYSPFLVMGKGYDVIYCDDSYPFYPGLVKLASPRSKVVIRLGDFHLMYYYSGIVYKILHFFEKIAWRMADEIIVISKVMGYKLLAEGFDSMVALDPVDPKHFPQKPRTGGKRTRVMFHGVLNKNKNVDIMLEAAKRLPSTDFIIVGDGPERRRLERIAPPNVFFDRWVPFHEIHKTIAQCDIGVALRGGNEGNQYVVTSPFLQYGVSGRACLVSKREVFEDYPWQFSDVNEFVNMIVKLKYHPEEGEKLRKFILTYHNARKIGDEIWQILMQV